MQSTRVWLARNTVRSALISAVLGAGISVVVNNALIEISLTPFFAALFGGVLLLLGALMLWRKLVDTHDPPCLRCFVVLFSLLVLFSGFSCFLLEKDWFKTISPVTKIPLYMSIAISLSFALCFTLVDCLNAWHDRRGKYDLRQRSIVSSPEQVAVVLAGAISMGAAFGLMFGAFDVEDDPSSAHIRLRNEERASLPIGALIGGAVGVVNSALSYRSDMGLGEQIDLLRGERGAASMAGGWDDDGPGWD
jgi:uncharacterized membrane protein YozB (DUF420 family)